MSEQTRRRRAPLWLVLLVRYLTGQPLTGKPYSDGTFFSRGVEGPGSWFWPGGPSPWAKLPGWVRLVVRIGVPATPVAYAIAPEVTYWTLGLLVVGPGILAFYRAGMAWQRRTVYRRYVRPMHYALQASLSLAAGVRPLDYIDVPVGFLANQMTPVTVTLPDSFDANAENEKRVGELVLQKIGLYRKGTHSYAIDTIGTPVLTVFYEPVPPQLVRISELVTEIDACEKSEVVLGRTAERVFRWNMAAESPHGAASCESGTGKSSLLQALAAQVVRKHPDNRVVGLDPKQASLTAVAGLPGVTVFSDPLGPGIEQMWQAVTDVRTEVDRRSSLLKADPTAEFPVLLLAIDEINMLASITRQWWEKVRENTDPKKAPFWEDLMLILCAGRQLSVHVFIVGQDLRDSAIGGIGLRTLIGLRAIAGYDAQMWTRFIQTRPIPRPPAEVGRWYYVSRGKRLLVQNVFGTAAELVDLGRGVSLSPSAPSVHVESGTATEGDTPGGQSLIVGLADGAAYLGITQAAFKKRRQRQDVIGETKVGRTPAWTPEVLDAFGARFEEKAS